MDAKQKIINEYNADIQKQVNDLDQAMDAWTEAARNYANNPTEENARTQAACVDNYNKACEIIARNIHTLFRTGHRLAWPEGEATE